MDVPREIIIVRYQIRNVTGGGELKILVFGYTIVPPKWDGMHFECIRNMWNKENI